MKRLAIAGQEAGFVASLEAHDHDHDEEADGCR
jgi:pyridoxine 5-phosphate synthase